MFTAPAIPAGFKEVSKDSLSTVLSNSGNRGMGYFFKDDVIIVPAEAECKVIGKPKDDKNPDSDLIPYIGVLLNDVARWVPMSAFRRWPSKDSAGFASKTPLMQSLFVGSDAERLDCLYGKTIQVTDLVEGETRDWTACPPGYEGDLVYRKAKFPVLAEKK